MKKIIGSLLLGLSVCLISCKDDVKSDMEDLTEVSADGVVKEVSQEAIKQSNDEKVRQSVMTKIMVTPELGKFASFLVSANLSNMLSTEKGPYTIFAPSTEAFSKLSEAQLNMLTNQKNKALLATALQQHMIAQNLGTDDLVQALRDTDTLVYSGLTGINLKVVKRGDALFVMDPKGHEAAILESDIIGNNGVVHIIDAVLGID